MSSCSPVCAALNGAHMQQISFSVMVDRQAPLPAQARKTFHGVGAEPGALSGLPCCYSIG